MELGEVLADEDLRQQEFPITRDKIFLAHAAVGPFPARVNEALKKYVNLASSRAQFEYLHRSIEEETRHMASRMLEATPDEICFVASTSAGLSLVAIGLEWKPGDNIVVAEGDFPANIYPWLNLRSYGVAVRFIPHRLNAPITEADVKDCIDDRTRLVSLSSVHYVTGASANTEDIGRFLQEAEILFCVDAIQSLGAMPCSVQNVDFLVADAHKWLLGPQGFGLLFVRKELWDTLHPRIVGWKSVLSPQDFLNLKLVFQESAKRYEPGSLNVLGLIGFHAALSLILEVGLNEISNQVIKLRAMLMEGLKERGYTVLGPAATEFASGITSFKHSDKNMSALYQKLDERGIIVSLRDDWTGDPCIRVAPHFYNTEDEIAVFLANL